MPESYYRIRKHRRPWGSRYTVALVGSNGEPFDEVYTSKAHAERSIPARRAAAATTMIQDETGEHGDSWPKVDHDTKWVWPGRGRDDAL